MQIAVLEGYRAPRSGGRKGRKMKTRSKRKGRSAFATAGKACAREGHRPGTKGFGSCMRAKLRKG